MMQGKDLTCGLCQYAWNKKKLVVVIIMYKNETLTFL